MKTRALTAFAIAAVASIGLAGCVQSSNAATGSASGNATGKAAHLTVFISGDTNVQDLWQKSLIPAFEKQYPNVTVSTTIDLHGQHDAQTQANLAAAVKADKTVGYDLVDAGWVSTVGKAGLLTKINNTEIPNLKQVPAATIAQGGTGGIPYRASSVLLAYDSTKVKNPPKTLDDVLAWIKANPGQFAYNSPASGGSGGSFVTTVLSKYMTKAQQQTMATTYDKSLESEWSQGWAELKALGPSMYQHGVYPNGNDQVLQMLGSGEISMAPVWSDQFITAQSTGQIGKNVKYTQISNPSFTGSASFLGIPKTEPAAKKQAAFELANFVLSSTGQQDIAKAVSGFPVIPLSALPASVREQFQAADPSQLRLPFSSQFTADMNQAWSAEVPQ
ncbi:extracellular solute-binding protein [Curtobacterium ammoniigenes]|uniref:extracellular solute-binding protein n=1 Tax=Curtobacterium ammoniigenes TaxID=395387 RepID=UPI00083102FF|nr:extracellular solute-binding protein [Curtobacterium ammoniigenes]